jgi:predicted NAD-dependent protein-ADP-ribosyltransferase YbiA (DUF1768 family)
MTNLNIWYGSNENPEFSNLAGRRFVFNGIRYVTVEHAYQTLKSGKFDMATYGKPWGPGKKFLGKRADRNTNIALMTRLIHESFKQNAEVLGNLTAIHPSVKITHNQDRGIWRTEFPRILEELRTSS